MFKMMPIVEKLIVLQDLDILDVSELYAPLIQACIEVGIKMPLPQSIDCHLDLVEVHGSAIHVI
jgi:hypothetical protein